MFMISRLLIALLIFTCFKVNSQNFEKIELSNLTGIFHYDYADINGDKLIDIVINHGGELKQLINKGETPVSFDLVEIKPTISCAADFELADFDGDGSIDIVLGDRGGEVNIVYFKKNGIKVDKLGFDDGYAFRVHDVDDDNDLDIISINPYSKATLLKNTKGKFTAEELLSQMNAIYGVEVDNINKMPKPEIVIGAEGIPSGPRVFYNTKVGNFEENIISYQNKGKSIKIGDFNFDGFKELVFMSKKQIKIYYITGKGFEERILVSSLFDSLEEMTVGTLDAQKQLYIFYTEYNAPLKGLKVNFKEGQFKKEEIKGLNGVKNATDINVFDLNGDGKNDIIYLDNGLMALINKTE